MGNTVKTTKKNASRNHLSMAINEAHSLRIKSNILIAKPFMW